MFIVNFILFTLFVYIIIYSIYTLTLNIKAFGAKQYIQDSKMLLDSSNAQNNLCVLVWADSSNKNLYDLLKILDNQTLNRMNYEVHVVFKKDGESAPLASSVYGAQIHIIENPDYFSKDKALSLFVNKMVEERRFSAFVFLGADRIIDENYLLNINKVSSANTVLSGTLGVVCRKKEFFKQLKCQVVRAYLKYQNKVQNIVRTMFEMPIILDGSNCVIGSEILEKTGRVCIETKNDELKFSLFLASNSIKPTFSPFINTKIDIENFDASSASLAQRISMFKYYFFILFTKPWYFKEFVFHILKPDALCIFVSYFALLFCAFKYYTYFELKFTFQLGVLLFLNFILGAIAAKLSIKELVYILFYPLCIFYQRAKIFMRKISLVWIEEKIHEEENVNSATVNAIVFDGKKDNLCKLVLVSEDGMRKVVFECGKRHITSDSFIRMYDAMSDMINKLSAKGLVLRICQNCGNFVSTPDGTVDLLKGECAMASLDENSQAQTLIWNCCPNFINMELKNIIDNLTNKDNNQ